jgi:hypothetical protein
MNQWTDAARQELENYFNRVRPTLRASGADAEEVIEDLRRHLATEVQSAQLPIVTEEDVRRLLTRIGAPEPAKSEPLIAPQTPPPQKPAPPKAGILLLIVAVLIPLATLFIEFATGMCADTFFDPMPTLWHVALVAMVPVSNAFVWAAVRFNDSRRRALLGWANGVATGIAIFYTLLFVPLMLPGLIGVVFFGFGLLPLGPSFSLVGALLLRSRLRRLGEHSDSLTPLSGLWRGIALALLALVAIETPNIITRMALQKTLSDDPEQQLTGIRWLRAVGQEDKLLRDCYGYTARAMSTDLVSWFFAGRDRATPEEARIIYFRVTGRAFNSVPAPNVRTGRGNWGALDDWTWDHDQGGETVGGRIKGLFLASSRLDTTINSDAAWSYTEWTMEFRNDSRVDREARAQILLPPGGVVSRLTLWVNGEEREAAFAGRAQTREAYQQVAIQQRRDPVLVTTSGPDRVQMQCFPVPPNGGLIKIRMGITAPLHLVSETNGFVRLPVALERNYTVPKEFKHSVWAHGPVGMTSDCGAMSLEPFTQGQVALRGQVEDQELSNPRGLLHVPRNTDRRFAWTKDTRTAGNHFIRQEIFTETQAQPAKVFFVLDGSVGMASHWKHVTQALTNLPGGLPWTALVASDRVETATNATALARILPTGGQDNLPALLEAWNLAVRTPGSVIIWIHGPQPMKIASEAALLQAIERTPARPEIYELQTEPGPDRIVEQLENLRSLRSVLRMGALGHDLSELLAAMRGKTSSWKLRRFVAETEAAAQADHAVEGSLHIARLWANDSVKRLKSDRMLEEATKQAALFQLVTPVSGAVVLETMAQFTQHGLHPVDAESVPAVPEPGVGTLVIVGLLALRFARKQRGIIGASRPTKSQAP